MNKLTRTIQKVLRSRDDNAIMEQRRTELAQMVEDHGIEAVSEASGLMITSIQQYLRDKRSKIGTNPLNQARFVFDSDEYKKVKSELA